MKLLKTNSVKSTIYAELEISLEELQLLESIISQALKNSNESEIGEQLEILYLHDSLLNSLNVCERLQPYLLPKAQLEKYVLKFQKWLAQNYSEEQIKQNKIDDAGYPYWAEIESYFSEIVTKNQISDLDIKDKINLLYLIARNWDIGSMISWLYQKRPLSSLGNLSDKDFIDLSKIVVELDEIEFEDAKGQFISSFKKFEKLTPEIEEILLRAYSTDSEYIKRLALLSLAKLNYPQIRDLIKLSWETEESEDHRMGCIEAIAEYVKDKALLEEYLNKASTDNRKYISEYVKKIKSEADLIQ